MNKVIFGFALASLSTVSSAKNLEGFKELKFGMSEEQVTEMGFECSNSESTGKGERVCYNFNYANTIFDVPTTHASVYIDVKNKVRSISVNVDSNVCAKVLDTMTISLGQPNSKKNKEANLNKKDSAWYRQSTWNFTNAKMSHMIADLGVRSVPLVCVLNFDINNYAKVSVKPSSDF